MKTIIQYLPEPRPADPPYIVSLYSYNSPVLCFVDSPFTLTLRDVRQLAQGHTAGELTQPRLEHRFDSRVPARPAQPMPAALRLTRAEPSDLGGGSLRSSCSSALVGRVYVSLVFKRLAA